jgi:RsiW-degrading membrane proteinase PrsW (M82 family)
MYFFSLLALALAPGVAIGLYIYLKDKHEREPLLLLCISFLYGALSAVITLVVSLPVNLIIITKEQDVVHQFVNAFFKVALIEESCKFLFVRFILFNNKNFNEPFDGIVYAVMVSLGFATLENVLYVFQSGFITGVLRLFTAVPAHATFGVMMGFYLGKAKFTHRQGILLSVIALTAATLFHGMYDYFWFISYVPGIWIAAIVSLLIGFVLSRKAIRLHQQASPFIDHHLASNDNQVVKE